MEAIGDKLRTIREEQGRSIEELARETNIAKRYIVALEEENFDVFPGEPYLIGFLRTYSETLGLVPDEIVALYKNFKIQEQPLPMDELIKKPKGKKWWLIPVILILLGGAFAGLFFLVPGFREGLNGTREKTVTVEAEPIDTTGTVYEMRDEIIERRFLEGDAVQVLMADKEFPLRLASIGDKLTLSAPVGEIEVSVGEETVVDLDGDDSADIKIYLRDIDSSAEPVAAIVRFDKFTQTIRAVGGGVTAEGEPSIFAEEGAGSEGAAGVEAVTMPGIGAANYASREQRTVTIFGAAARGPFTLDIIFRGYCMLRYVTDAGLREERYFHKGETFRMEGTDSVWLWMSNGGACRGRIAGNEIEFGRPGEVVTKLIEWRRNEDAGNWELTLLPAY